MKSLILSSLLEVRRAAGEQQVRVAGRPGNVPLLQPQYDGGLLSGRRAHVVVVAMV